MNTIPRDKTLLTLLLALRNLENSLSRSEQAQLYEVGEQLELDPDDWEFIEEGLLAIVTANPFLHKEFQSANDQLNYVDIQKLLPTDKDKEDELELSRVIERRGDRDKPQDNSPPLIEITSKFLKHTNLMQTIKQSNWLFKVANNLKP